MGVAGKAKSNISLRNMCTCSTNPLHKGVANTEINIIHETTQQLKH